MYASSRHETPSLTSLTEDGGVSCFGSSPGMSPHPVSDSTQPCLISIKLMELAGPIGHAHRSRCSLMLDSVSRIFLCLL